MIISEDNKFSVATPLEQMEEIDDLRDDSDQMTWQMTQIR